MGSMQESPTLLILRCRARHCWERHSLTHTCSERASLQCTLMGGSRWEPGWFRSHSLVRCRAVKFFLLFACLPCPGAVDSRLSLNMGKVNN